MKMLIAGLVSIVSISPAVAAMETIGTITAEFDGATIEQATMRVDQDGEKSATAEISRVMNITSISIYGTGKGQISLEIMYTAKTPGPDTPLLEASVQHFPGGIGPHWTSEGAPDAPRIRFTTLDTDGEEGRAEGTFEATLCWVEKIGRDADAGNCKPISGSFSTKLFEMAE